MVVQLEAKKDRAYSTCWIYENVSLWGEYCDDSQQAIIGENKFYSGRWDVINSITILRTMYVCYMACEYGS